MSYLFDSSSIFVAFKRNDEDLLLDNYTISLVVFELGNIVWKEVYLFRSLSLEDAREMLELLSEVLSTMQIIEIKDLSVEILELATGMGLTYYDAAYAYVAMDRNLVLVTEDKKLRSSSSKTKIRAISLNQLK
ncbi:MAG: PIN domain-containing protein [Candidatus Njordarchaeia archaeon]